MSPRGAEIFFTVLFSCLVFWELFLPPVIGSADNGDFAKVAGRYCIGVNDYGAFAHKYFQPAFVSDRVHCWDSGIPTSEFVPASVAVTLGLWWSGGKSFDLRWLGALHGILLTASFWLLMRAARPLGFWPRAAFGFASVWILADPAYVSYMSSFYGDTVALIGLVVLASSAAWLAQCPASLLPLFLSGVGAVMFVTSKSQHALWGFLLAAAAFSFARRRSPVTTRRMAAGAGIALLLASAYMLGATSQDYRLLPRFNVVFSRIVKDAPRPMEALAELGLEPGDAKYVGMHAFMPGNPTQDMAWRQRFIARTGWLQVLRYYLRHPLQTAKILRSNLGFEACYLRTVPNYRREDGFPPESVATGPLLWTTLRGALLKLWPWHVVVWLGGVGLCSVAVIARRAAGVATRLAWIGLGLVGLAVLEYSAACLADAAETFRHLLIFHQLTDLTVLFALGCILAMRSAGREHDPLTKEAAC
jgi:hypothetical protein